MVMPAASKQLKGKTLQRIIPGSYTLGVYGFDVGVNAARNGNLKLTFLGHEMTGKWTVKGNELCITLIEGNQSETSCSVVDYDGKKYFSAGGLTFH